jgi:hypothetical protein
MAAPATRAELAGDEALAEAAQARPRVEDHRGAARRADAHARGVPAEPVGGRTGHGIRPANSPELNEHLVDRARLNSGNLAWAPSEHQASAAAEARAAGRRPRAHWSTLDGVGLI